MSWSIDLFRIKGIQLRVHVTFALILIWGAYYWSSVADDGARGALFGVVATLLLFLCVTLHELGHALQARAYGIGVQDITLYPIGGVARLADIPRNPMREFRIAIAGPLVNVAIVILVVAIGRLVDEPALRGLGNLRDEMRDSQWKLLLRYLGTANLALAVFNLLPAFPMDGGRILRSLLAMRFDYARATRIAAGIGQAMALFFGLFGFATGNFLLIVVAVFVWMGAGQESQQTSIREILGRTTVGEVMTRQPWSVAPDFPIRRAAELTLSTPQSDFPVVDRGGAVVGMLTLPDIMRGLQSNPDSAIAELMQRQFQLARPYEPVVEVQERFASGGGRALPVIGDRGELAGLLTVTDIAEAIRLLSVRGPAAVNPAPAA
jgi:stage IV sporulation protein FB